MKTVSSEIGQLQRLSLAIMRARGIFEYNLHCSKFCSDWCSL